MASIRTEIEIARPPAKVRDVFLDFQKYPEWSQKHFTTISSTSGAGSVEVGDSLTVTIGSMSFSPKVLENSLQAFKWVGSLPYILTGEHYFSFEPSKTTPGGTTFMQGEDFSGALAFLVRLSIGPLASTEAGFRGFNEELKQRVESQT